MQFCINNTTQYVHILHNTVNHDMSNPNVNKQEKNMYKCMHIVPNPVSILVTLSENIMTLTQGSI
jgi:hypothetical protein